MQNAGGASVNMGQGYELEAIAACTIGGVSVNGGIGRISGVVIGVLVFELLKSSMQFLGIQTNYQYIVQGIVIIVELPLISANTLQRNNRDRIRLHKKIPSTSFDGIRGLLVLWKI